MAGVGVAKMNRACTTLALATEAGLTSGKRSSYTHDINTNARDARRLMNTYLVVSELILLNKASRLEEAE